MIEQSKNTGNFLSVSLGASQPQLPVVVNNQDVRDSSAFIPRSQFQMMMAHLQTSSLKIFTMSTPPKEGQ